MGNKEREVRALFLSEEKGIGAGIELHLHMSEKNREAQRAMENLAGFVQHLVLSIPKKHKKNANHIYLCTVLRTPPRHTRLQAPPAT